MRGRKGEREKGAGGGGEEEEKKEGRVRRRERAKDRPIKDCTRQQYLNSQPDPLYGNWTRPRPRANAHAARIPAAEVRAKAEPPVRTVRQPVS